MPQPLLRLTDARSIAGGSPAALSRLDGLRKNAERQGVFRTACEMTTGTQKRLPNGSDYNGVPNLAAWEGPEPFPIPMRHQGLLKERSREQQHGRARSSRQLVS